MITEELSPVYQDAEMAVFGVNTAGSLTWKDGRINGGQIEELRRRLCADVLLGGHLHVADSTTTGNHYGHASWRTIMVSAGIATSTRGRGAPNSFNEIRIEGRRSVRVIKWCCDPEKRAFQELSHAESVRNSDGWIAAG